VSVTSLILGVDAGGTSVRARGCAGDRVVFAGRGGPGNPLAADIIELRRSYEDALDGCPPPAVIAACVAGAGSPEGKDSIERILIERFPLAPVHVVPDYVATWMTAPEGTDVVVVCGTGSIACTRKGDGSFRTSGGHGWLLSDHGSAARLGKAVLEYHCINSEEALRDQLHRLYGVSDANGLAIRLRTAANPGAAMAAAAQLLTDAAESGSRWASLVLRNEMDALVRTATQLLPQQPPGDRPAQIALTGGVFRSSAARRCFRACCDRFGLYVTVVEVDEESVVGAVRLGEALMRGEDGSH
jgi:N-acetylglucosamine kinase-like BadF-type ATPase